MYPLMALMNQKALHNSDVTKLHTDQRHDYNVEKCGCKILIPKYMGPSNSADGNSKQAYFDWQ
jgi:hypothetical protein